MSEELFKKMFEKAFNPEIQGCLSAIESVAGYRLSSADKKPFLYFHDSPLFGFRSH